MKIGDIVIEKGEVVQAFWRPADEALPDVLLCCINRYVFETHSFVQEQFVNLATVIAANLNRSAGEAITVQPMAPAQPAEAKIDRRQFACWNCSHPQATDAHAHLRDFSDGDLTAALSPHGTPTFCCKVTSAAQLSIT